MSVNCPSNGSFRFRHPNGQELSNAINYSATFANTMRDHCTINNHWFVYATSLAIAIAILSVPGTNAIPVYDAEDPNVEYRSIDLVNPAPCPDPVLDYAEPVTKDFQILQTETAVPVEAHRCKVYRSKEVTRCGFNSISYGKQWTEWNRDMPLDPRQCREAVLSGQVTIEGHVFQVARGARTDLTFVSRGALSDNGRCEVATFWSGGRQFTDSYEVTAITIEIAILRGTTDFSTGDVTFTNGIRAPYKDKITQDDLEGTIVWEADDQDCLETVGQIYYGKGQLHRRFNADGGNLNAIVMVGNEDKDQFAGLTLTRVQGVCGVHCYGTQIKGVAVCVLREDDEPIIKADEIRPHFDLKASRTQTQLGWLNLGTNLRVQQRFQLVQSELCQLERKILSNTLRDLAGGNSRYALYDAVGIGHAFYKAGATAYVIKGVMKEAVQASHPNCTEEIPVMVEGRKRFADPITWVLSDFPTVIPCSDVMPVRWLIAGDWYCAGPEVRRCIAPLQLNTTVSAHTPLGDFTKGFGKSLYSPLQITRHLTFIRAMQSRVSVLSKVTYDSIQNEPGPNGEVGSIIGHYDLDQITNIISYNILPLFWLMGTATTYFMGALFAIAILNTLGSCAMRVYVLYKERGFGIWLLWAVWTTTYHILRTPLRVAKATIETVQDHPEGIGNAKRQPRSGRGFWKFPHQQVQDDVERAQTLQNTQPVPRFFYTASPDDLYEDPRRSRTLPPRRHGAHEQPARRHRAPSPSAASRQDDYQM